MSNKLRRGRPWLLLGFIVLGVGCLLAILLLQGGLLPSLFAERVAVSLREPEPRDARQVVLEAFASHPLVVLSEAHGLQEQADYVIALIRHPDFARTVNAIVLEAGNALHQKLIDDYVQGGDVPLSELRRVWRDHTCAALGPRDSPNLEALFATVREVNQHLPPHARVRVLAGDPPIDWTKVESGADVLPWLAQRDLHYARVVDSEVLAKNQKALLIIGGAHLDRGPLPSGRPEEGLMLQILEHRFPGQTFVVVPHEGFGPQNATWEPKLSDWPRPSAALVAGTWLALPQHALIEDVLEKRKDGGTPSIPRPKADALLYLGPRDGLTMEQVPRETYADADYVKELDRRSRLCRGQPLDLEALTKPRSKKWAEAFPAGDVFIRAR